MTRKFTFLLMALLALTGLQGWAQQRGYTYEKLTGAPDPNAEYVLGYQDNSGNYYFHSSGETNGSLTLTSPDASEPKLYTITVSNSLYTASYASDKYLHILGSQAFVGPKGSNVWDVDHYLDFSNGYIKSYSDDYHLYHDGNIIKSSNSNNAYVYFYKRTGSSAPTYTVTLTQIEGGTLKASKDGGFNYTTGPISAENGARIYLNHGADPFHEFDYDLGWTTTPEDFAVEIISDGDVFHFNMPAYDVTIQASYSLRPTHAIEVIHSEGGVTSVTYNGEDISAAPAGLLLTLSATPDADHVFSKWEIRNGEYLLTTLVEANTTFYMPEPGYYHDESAPITFQAIFSERPKYTVNFATMQNGSVTASTNECYSGTTVTLTANANSGYQYVYGNISVVDANGQTVTVNHTNNGGSFTMPGSDVTVSATFKKLYSVSMGTVQNGSAYAMPGSAVSGATVSVFVTPNAGCAVFGVRADYDGGYVQASYEYTTGEGQLVYLFDMPAYDVTVNVDIRQTYTVSYTQSTGGAFSVSPTTNVMHSQRVDIVITGTETHYSFDDANYENKIIVKDASEETVIVNRQSNGQYYFSMPASDATVSVTFDEDPKNDITVNNPEGCTINVYPSSENVYYLTNVGLTCNLQEGYRFVEWVVKDVENPITVYDGWFTMPNSPNVTVTATLEAVEAHTVNIAEGITGGSVSAYTENDHEAPINAYENEIVCLNNTPETGYQFVSYTVTSEYGTVEVNNNFYFYMPDCDVTISATFALEPQNLTVNDGEGINQNIPTTTAQTWYSTKSQFIIPYDQLESMYDGTITDLTFYSDYSNFNFDNARWNVYVKEVDYQTLNDYASTEGMTLVYNGGMSIADYKLHIDFDTDFQYNDNNLLIYFEQTQAGSCTDSWQNWYGVNTSKATAYAGYDYGTGWWESNHYPQWFLPKTTFRYMPSANPQARYNIVVNNTEGINITASKTMATQGTIITLSRSLEEGYVFNNWVVMQGETPVAVENDQFEMPAGDVTVTADVTAPTYYDVYLDGTTDYTIYADPIEHILAGKTITLSADTPEGKTVDAWTVTERISGTPVEVTYNDYYNCYQFTMPEDDVDVTATFRDLKQCTINFYVNGVKWDEKTENVFENEYIYFDDKVLETTPAGTTFTGWKTSEIETFETEYPQNIYSQWSSFQVKDNTDFYAVFSFTEKVPTGEIRWSQLTMVSQLEDGDEVVFEGYAYDYAASTGYYYLLSQRSDEYATVFGRTAGMSWDALNQGNFPEGTIVFTAVNNAGSWNLVYNDKYAGTSTLAVTQDGSIGPKSYLGGYDNWNIYSYSDPWTDGYTYNVETNNYINFNAEMEYFYGGECNVAASLYRKNVLTYDYNYYMTSVLGIGGADEHIAANTEVPNVVIANNAKLTIDNGATLDVAGICLSAKHDAAQLVVEDGAQLIHNNAGTVATMKKNITGNDWYTISSPLANSVEFANVENLIPSSGVTGTDYDLYRLNEAEGIWENSRIEDQSQNEFTTIDKGLGYIYANAGADHIAFAGEVNVADAECTLTNSATNGFNLIGNPFSQNIELANVAGVTLADGFYVLSNDGDWGAKLTDSDIKPLQGFLVQATEEGGTARISKNASVRGERSKEQSTSIEMIVSNSNHRDNAYAMFGEGIGLNKINHRNAEAPMLYIPQSGEDFAIAFMDENTTLFPVSFKAMTTGKYSVSLKATDNISTLVLVDNMTGVETNMLLESSYSFIGSPADKENRFTVKLGISHNDNDENEQFVYQYGNELIIDGEGTLQVFDVLGRVVISEEVHGQRVDVSNLTKGAYIVRMTGNEVKTQKIIVR